MVWSSSEQEVTTNAKGLMEFYNPYTLVLENFGSRSINNSSVYMISILT